MNENFLRYNALDSACMMEIYQKFWNTLEEEGYSKTYDMTIQLYPVLQFMQLRGMKVNGQLLEETKIEVTSKIEAKQEELNKLVGHPLNINSPKAVANYFYVELGCDPILSSKTKKITTDDLALSRLARGTAKRGGLRQASLIQEIRGLSKLYSTYLNIAFDDDGRMRGSYNPRGTKFGRLSSSKTIFGTGMNFQNLPQEFKKFLTADDGYVLVELDKRQAEWVVVAYLANDANMIQAIQEGQDVHTHTAHLMFGLPPEIIDYERDRIGHSTASEEIRRVRQTDEVLSQIVTDRWPENMSLRQCGKKSNHGLNYDESFRGFAILNSITEKESKRIVELYHSIYPNIRLYYDTIKRQLQKDRTLTNCFGRKVRFMDEWGPDLWRAAYAMLPQSTVVDSLNQGMVRIYNDPLLTQIYNCDILAQVHDSLLLQIPKAVVQDREKWEILLSKCMSYLTPTLSYNGTCFTIETDIQVGLNWGEYNGKTNRQGMQGYSPSKYTELLKLLEQ